MMSINPLEKRGMGQHQENEGIINRSQRLLKWMKTMELKLSKSEEIVKMKKRVWGGNFRLREMETRENEREKRQS